MTLVVDASVLVKWLLKDPEREAQTEKATVVMERIIAGRESIVQPAHWLLEVAAVLTRIAPETAESDVAMLRALEFPVDDSPGTLQRACSLAIDLQQHVFDTAYHAVALEATDASLITADERYLRAAGNAGCVLSLAEWTPR